MPYDEALADRIRRVLGTRPDISEKMMFGGLAFLRDGKMFCGLAKGELMVRVGPGRYEDSLSKAHTRKMDFTGRPMKGYVYVDAAGLRTDEELSSWIELGDAFVATLGKTPQGKKKSRLNAAWHETHPMPKKPTTAQRIAWHQEHEKHCGCRPMPASLRAMLK